MMRRHFAFFSSFFLLMRAPGDMMDIYPGDVGGRRPFFVLAQFSLVSYRGFDIVTRGLTSLYCGHCASCPRGGAAQSTP